MSDPTLNDRGSNQYNPADCKDTDRLIEMLREEIEWLKAENFKFYARACSAENELSDKNKRIKDLRNVIANLTDIDPPFGEKE